MHLAYVLAMVLATTPLAPSPSTSGPSAPTLRTGYAPAQPARSRGASDKPRSLDDQRAATAQELARLGAALQAEIEAGNVEAVAARIPGDGLRCGDRVLPRDRVLRDLRGPDTWLHRVLFGAPEKGGRRGEPASLRALFAEAREVAVLIAFARDARAGPEGRPCLDYRAKDLVNPARPFCFEKRGGAWWLTQSLYPCGPTE